MAQGAYRQVGDWKVVDTAYCLQYGFVFSSSGVLDSLLGINQETQFNETITPYPTHAAYLEYTGTALREKQNVLLAVLCPQEMNEDEYWESIDSLMVGDGGSSIGAAWQVLRTDPSWDGTIDLEYCGDSDNLADAFARMKQPYELRLYTYQRELLETIPLKGGALDAGNNVTEGNNAEGNNAGAENK